MPRDLQRCENRRRHCSTAVLGLVRAVPDEQALQLAEKTAAYDLDCVVAMIVQVLYMLHEGRMSVAQSVFPLVSAVTARCGAFDFLAASVGADACVVLCAGGQNGERGAHDGPRVRP